MDRQTFKTSCKKCTHFLDLFQNNLFGFIGFVPKIKIQVINQIFKVLVRNVDRNTLNNCAYLDLGHAYYN